MRHDGGRRGRSALVAGVAPWRRTRTGVLGCALAAVLAVACCGCDASAVTSTLDNLRSPEASYQEARDAQAAKNASATPPSSLVREGFLTVGVPRAEALAPLVFVDEDGTLTGLDEDLMAALAEEMGLSVRFVEVDASGRSLGTTCDVVVGVAAEDYAAVEPVTDGEATDGDAAEDAADAEDAEADAGDAEATDEAAGAAEDASADEASGEDAAEVVDPGVTVVGTFAVRGAGVFAPASAGSRPSVSVESLAGRRVAVQSGSTSAAALSELGVTVQMVPEDNLNGCFEALESGAADYVVCDVCAGAYLARDHDDVALAGTLDEPVPLGVGVASDDAELLRAVREAFGALSDNGRLALVSERWLGPVDVSAVSQLPGAAEAMQAARQADAEQSGEDAGETDEAQAGE